MNEFYDDKTRMEFETSKDVNACVRMIVCLFV